ncbi:putative oxidoreductase, oxygen dependent, FAD-dependent protein [Thioalkalivibrio nitratireducens DSM 14787]|nr:BBE domain-containing protein [Thioalkalivibrio nitratireducens]AGA34501.1 putative oxidoreductase, oxygen dependent, FAD-dependent protein [Thioalkalivibrio nitratireducens DSM 14787]
MRTEAALPHRHGRDRVAAVVGTAWDEPEDDAANIAWAREAWQDLKAFSTGGAYINFQTEDEGSERMEAALGPALQRLAEIKQRWDPDNRFRVNRNIPPSGKGHG